MSKQEGSGTGKPAAKPQNIWKTVKRFTGYMKNSSWLIGLVLFMAIAGTLMQIISPKQLGQATTLIFEGVRTGSGIDIHHLLFILLTVTGLYAGVFITSFLQERTVTVVAQKNGFNPAERAESQNESCACRFF